MALIPLTPAPDVTIDCVQCNTSFGANDWAITGIHNMCSGECPQCHQKYFKEMPVNAGLFYPGILNAATGKRSDKLPYENWYLVGLEEAYKHRTNKPVEIAIEKNRPFSREKVAILNTIDHCYGHCLFELFNASYYLNREDVDLVILVQKNLRWLVPDGAAEVWVVDIPFKLADAWYDDLATAIKTHTKDLRNLHICMSFVQADDADYDIEQYSRVKPFPLNEWNERLAKPTVTFIWRSDRFWKDLLPKIIDNRFTRKLFPKLLAKLNKRLQVRWVIKFAETLKERIPTLDFAVAGMDQMDVDFPAWIKDFRFSKHTDEDAIRACERYAESHLVLGCNGSSLILPSCHAGAVIDIVPMNQWAASSGSFAFRLTSHGDTQFRYILLPPEVKMQRLALISISMLRDRTLIELHTSRPWRNHDAGLPPEAWAKFRLESFELSKYFKDHKGLVTRYKNN